MLQLVYSLQSLVFLLSLVTKRNQKISADNKSLLTSGGLRAVMWTDTVQVVIMITGALILMAISEACPICMSTKTSLFPFFLRLLSSWRVLGISY